MPNKSQNSKYYLHTSLIQNITSTNYQQFMYQTNEIINQMSL